MGLDPLTLPASTLTPWRMSFRHSSSRPSLQHDHAGNPPRLIMRLDRREVHHREGLRCRAVRLPQFRNSYWPTRSGSPLASQIPLQDWARMISVPGYAIPSLCCPVPPTVSTPHSGINPLSRWLSERKSPLIHLHNGFRHSGRRHPKRTPNRFIRPTRRHFNILAQFPVVRYATEREALGSDFLLYTVLLQRRLDTDQILISSSPVVHKRRSVGQESRIHLL